MFWQRQILECTTPWRCPPMHHQCCLNPTRCYGHRVSGCIAMLRPHPAHDSIPVFTILGRPDNGNNHPPCNDPIHAFLTTDSLWQLGLNFFRCRNQRALPRHTTRKWRRSCSLACHKYLSTQGIIRSRSHCRNSLSHICCNHPLGRPPFC